VQIPGAVRFELYKNPIPTAPLAPSHLVLSSTSFHAIEVCTSTGCYRAQVITDDGPSSLSNPICRTSVLGCCKSPGCPVAHYWDNVVCSCVPGALISDVFCPSQSACIGEAYADAMIVLGGSSPYLWELIGGSLPPGLALHTGLFAGQTAPITGTPTVGGSYSFSVRCTSTDGSFFEKDCTINVIALTNGSLLPGAITDTAYSAQLAAVGGESPFSFNLESGNLPAGLTLSGSGLISGTPGFSGSESFFVGVTDANGNKCAVPEILQVTGCPTPVAFPSVAITIQDYLTHSAFDPVRRIIWYPKNRVNPSGIGIPPYQVVYRMSSLSSPGWVADATDSLNLINTSAKGDLGNNLGRCLIDTKNNCFVAFGSQSWNSFYDLDTADCVAVVKCTGAVPQAYQNDMQQTYDAGRGHVYMPGNSGSGLRVQVLDCTPGVRDSITQHIAGSYNSGPGAYVPETDTLYIVNLSGANLLHKLDPVTGVFTLNTGPAGTARDIRYCPIAKILVVSTATTLVFIDPLNGDSLLGSVAWTDTLQFAVEGACTNYLYFRGDISGVLRNVSLSSPFGISILANPYTSGPLAYDNLSGLLWSNNAELHPSLIRSFS
jgi:hypothetical protein